MNETQAKRVRMETGVLMVNSLVDGMNLVS